jgi:hypothetical protein
MRFERQPSERTQRPEGKRAEGDVRDKAAIHYINLNAVGTRRFDGADRLTQPGKISGQNGWRNSNLQLSLPKKTSGLP